MDKQTFIDTMQHDFARYGFVPQPMSASDIGRCFDYGLSLEETYCVGCDMNAGLTLTLLGLPT